MIVDFIVVAQHSGHPSEPPPELISSNADGSFTHKPIDFDSEFIRRHLIFAYDPSGLRHDVPDLLESLFAHPKAGEFVMHISALALQACITRCSTVVASSG